MGSIGHLRSMCSSQHQQQQSIDMKQQTILTTNNSNNGNNNTNNTNNDTALHSSMLPSPPNPYMNDLLITTTQASIAGAAAEATASTETASMRTNPASMLSDSENDDINNFMIPKSLNFIIDRLSKVREEITTIEKFGQEKKMSSVLSAHNFQQDLENNHNIGNSSNNNTPSMANREDIATQMDSKKNFTVVSSKNKDGEIIVKHDKDKDQQNSQDTNNSSDSTLSQNEMSSSSSSSSNSSISSHSVSTARERLSKEAALGKHLTREYDSHDHINETKNNYRQEKREEEEEEEEDDDDETINVDDLKPSSEEPIHNGNNDHLPSTTMHKKQIMDNTPEDTIMILKQLMDKRNELKRLDKLVFNLITYHLMKITPTTTTTTTTTTTAASNSILPKSHYDYRLLSPNSNYENHSSSNKNHSSYAKSMTHHISTQPGEFSAASSTAKEESARLIGGYHTNHADHVFSSKNTSSSENLNMIGNENGSQSLIDLTAASSRQHEKSSAPNYSSTSGNSLRAVSGLSLLNQFPPSQKDSDNLYLAGQKLLPNMKLSDYDGFSPFRLSSNGIYGQNKGLESSSNVLKNSTNDDCPDIGLNLKTTNRNNESSLDLSSLSILKDMNYPAQSLVPMASTSYNLHSVAGIHDSHYQLNANMNNTTSHHNSALDTLNKQANINLPSNNGLGLNYSGHQSREPSMFATPYKPTTNNNSAMSNPDQVSGKTSSSNHHGDSLLRLPVNKKFRTSFSQQPESEMISNGTLDEPKHPMNLYLLHHGSLDYNHPQSSSHHHQELDLQQKHCQKLLQQQVKNSTTLKSSTAPESPPLPVSSLLGYHQQQQQRSYQNDFSDLLTGEQHNNNNDAIKSSCSHIDNMAQGILSSGSCRLVCHVCGSGFEDRHRLQQHLSIHLQLKPEWYSESTIKETMAQYEAKRGDYLCGQCDVRFDTTAEFDKHMQMHGDKPHRCELCFHDNSFRYWRQYLTHFRNHCFVYHCRFVKGCNHQCNRRDYLKSHILKHHLDNRLPEQYTG